MSSPPRSSRSEGGFGGGGGVDLASPRSPYLDFVSMATRYPPGHPLHGALIYGRRGSSNSDSDSMPPLEEIGRPPTSTSTSAGAGTARPPVGTSSAMSELIASALRSGDDDDNDDDDDVSVIEVVDLPHANAAHGNGGSSGRGGNMARRTRSHDKPAEGSSAAAASAAAVAEAEAAIASATAANSSASSPSPSPARRKPSGGLKTTGLESEDNVSPAKKPAAGKKRSADEVDNDDGTDVKKQADGNTDADADADKKKEAEQHCSICLDVPSREEVTKLNKCEHVFCFGCIETWADRENTCPLCKVRFTKIERVNKPPPSKRRKKGGGRGSAGGAKATKRIKTRDQREDLVSANPLEGLFQHLETTGAMPRSIAQLIFSGLGSGPNPFGGPRPYRFQTAARRTPPNQRRNDAAQSYTVARDPATGRFTRVPRESASSSSARSSSPAASTAASGAARRSTRGGGSRAAAGATSATSGTAAAAAASSSSRSVRPARSGRSGASAAAPHVSVTLNSFGPTSFNLPGSASPGMRPPRAFRFFQDSDDDDDDYEPPFARAGGYDSFVRRARAQQGRAHSPLGGADRFVVRREMRMPPTQAHLAPANTAETAIEIGDSDDDDEIVVLE